MKKVAVCIVLLSLGSLVLAFADSGNVEKRNTVCAVQDTVGDKAGLPHTYNGKTYYLCCEMCRKSITSDPAKYTVGTDPVSGNKVDKAVAMIYNLEGKAYYFENDANRSTFAKDPSKYVKQ